MVRKILPALLVLAGLMIAGCGQYGEVEQGRAVAFDKEKSIVTIVVDTNKDPKKPAAYTGLPTHQFVLPSVASERGADPTPALRMNLDVEKKTITMYNPKDNKIEDLKFEVLKDEQNVEVRRRHPLVWDAAANKAKKFPEFDAANKVIKIYSSRQSRYTEIKLSEADFGKYQGDQWNAGDECRFYYKVGPKDGKPGESLRFYNITKTDITRR